MITKKDMIFTKNYNYVAKIINSCYNTEQLFVCKDWLSRIDQLSIFYWIFLSKLNKLGGKDVK